jgi:hypothetical protein
MTMGDFKSEPNWLVKLLVAGAFSVTQVIIISTTAWIASTLMEVDRRVTVIESSRFTATDGAIFTQKVYDRLSSIEKEIITLTKSPPEWFRYMQRHGNDGS